MTGIQNLSSATPPTVIDTALADIYHRMARPTAQLALLQSRDWDRKRRGSDEQIAQARHEIALIEAEAAPFEAEYNARRWTRVFLVPGGHAHRSMACSTCYPSTQFAWMPEWSGRDEAEIVEAAASRACTVCYPSAPVDKPTQLYTPQERKDGAQREAEAMRRRELAKAKAAKAISYRGGELRVNGWVIKTEVTAWREGVDVIFNHEAYGYEMDAEGLARIVEALSDKLGKSPESIRETITTKVAAKHKREGR